MSVQAEWTWGKRSKPNRQVRAQLLGASPLSLRMWASIFTATSSLPTLVAEECQQHDEPGQWHGGAGHNSTHLNLRTEATRVMGTVVLIARRPRVEDSRARENI